MELPNKAMLIPLGNTDLTLAEGSQDLRGLHVKDVGGADIGKVEDLLIDDTEKRVRFLLVATGGVLSFAKDRFLIHVDAIGRIHKDHVHLARSRDDVASSPAYDPQLKAEDQIPVLDNLYAHYGLVPFWAAGYAYPGFPYFV